MIFIVFKLEVGARAYTFELHPPPPQFPRSAPVCWTLGPTAGALHKRVRLGELPSSLLVMTKFLYNIIIDSGEKINN